MVMSLSERTLHGFQGTQGSTHVGTAYLSSCTLAPPPHFSFQGALGVSMRSAALSSWAFAHAGSSS
jgi:hypothetical protein